MSFSHTPTIRLSALSIALVLVIVPALTLLIGKRLDLRFAGGMGAGPHADAVLEETYNFSNPSPSATPSVSSLTRGEAVTTDASTFQTYTLNNECSIALAENSSLMLVDGRKQYNVFNLLTGRAVAKGNCTFIVRETKITINGTATLVHFSWLDEIVIKTLDGSTVVSQSGDSIDLTSESSAMRFSTLPNAFLQEEASLSLTDNDLISSFYTWAQASLPLL